MIFRTQHLRNACFHADTTVEYGPGINGLVGPNGSGKTSLMAMAVGTLTNDFSVLPGVKLDNVRYLGRGEASFSRLVFDHGDLHLDLTRGLQKTVSRLIINNGPDPITGNDAINAELSKILGIDLRVLNGYVFVAQGKIDDILDLTDTARSAALKPLFQTEHIGRVAKHVGGWLSALRIQGASDEVPHLEGEIKRAREELAEAEKSLDQYDDLDGYDDASDPAHKVITRRERFEEYQSNLEAARRRVSRDEPAVEQASVAVREASEKIRKLQTAKDEAVADIALAQKAIADWEVHERLQAANARRQRELDRLAREKAELEAKTLDRPAKYVEKDAEAGYGERVRERIRIAKFAEKLIDQHGRPTKPTKIEKELLQVVDTDAAAIDDLKQEAENAATIVQRSRKFDKDSEALARDLEEARRSLTRAQESSAAEVPDAPEMARNAAQAILDAVDGVEREMKRANAELTTAKSDHAAASSRLEVNTEALRKLEKSPLSDVTDDEVAEAREHLKTLRQRMDERSRLNGRIDTLTSSIASQTKRLEKARHAAENALIIQETSKHIETVRSVLSTLTDSVALYYLQELEDDTNGYLELLNMPFRIEVGKDSQFVATFLDGTVQSAARLSGAQRILFALSFRMAVNRMFAPEIGVLALDEPTEFLDKENRLALRGLFEKLKTISNAQGVQIILTTHAQELYSVFDRTIRLGAA